MWYSGQSALLTNGWMTVQPCLYIPEDLLHSPMQVTVSGTTVMFSGSMGNVTGLALMNGVTYNVSVVARNSIGNSGMFIVMLFVPCECPGPANHYIRINRMRLHLGLSPLQSPPTSPCSQWQSLLMRPPLSAVLVFKCSWKTPLTPPLCSLPRSAQTALPSLIDLSLEREMWCMWRDFRQVHPTTSH